MGHDDSRRNAKQSDSMHAYSDEMDVMDAMEMKLGRRK